MSGSPPDKLGDSSASRALLSAALGGLLCLGVPACTSGDTTQPPVADSGSDAATNADPTCDGGPDAGMVTSSTTVANLTLDTFTSQCNAMSGTVEISSECAGRNSCRGMSYDSETSILTQHTCKGLNNCAGFSCVICN